MKLLRKICLPFPATRNRQQFAGHANDGTENVGKVNVLLHSSKPTDEQVTKQDAPGK